MEVWLCRRMRRFREKVSETRCAHASSAQHSFLPLPFFFISRLEVLFLACGLMFRVFLFSYIVYFFVRPSIPCLNCCWMDSMRFPAPTVTQEHRWGLLMSPKVRGQKYSRYQCGPINQILGETRDWQSEIGHLACATRRFALEGASQLSRSIFAHEALYTTIAHNFSACLR